VLPLEGLPGRLVGAMLAVISWGSRVVRVFWFVYFRRARSGDVNNVSGLGYIQGLPRQERRA
jgi:hypothetical protein